MCSGTREPCICGQSPIGSPTTAVGYSAEVQQHARTVASYHRHQHPALAGPIANRPGPPVVRDEEARARRVPDEVVDRGSPRSFPDNTASTATWLGAREPGRRGDLIRKRSARRTRGGPLRLSWSGRQWPNRPDEPRRQGRSRLPWWRSTMGELPSLARGTLSE